MYKAVIFDMYETLVTMNKSKPYFGTQIAADMGLSEAKFREIWDTTDEGRSTGEYTLRGVIEMIMKANDIYDSEVCDMIIARRRESRSAHFTDIREGIIPMLEDIKKLGLKIGLISNCFEEEVPAIKESGLYRFFDAAMLSYEQKIMKPNPLIFERALTALGLKAEECVYVGDGGSHELEAASKAGMRALQARWYLRENPREPFVPKEGFDGLDRPEELLEFLDKNKYERS